MDGIENALDFDSDNDGIPDFIEAIDDIFYVLDEHKVDRVSRNELLTTLYSNHSILF